MQLNGHEGSISFDGGAIAEVTRFTFSVTRGSINGNIIGSGNFDRSRNGRTSWQVEVEGNYDPSDTTGQVAIVDAATGTVEVYPAGETSGNQELAGPIRVEGFTITNQGDSDSNVEFRATLIGTGAYTNTSVT